MTTQKKKGEQASKPGIYNYMALMADFELIDKSTSWMEKGSCLGMDTDLFFPEKGDNIAVEEAKAICNKCEVKQTCLNWAMTNEIWHGVWGGLSGNQRYMMAKKSRREKHKTDSL